MELRGLQPGTNKRPGDVIALHFFGDGQHLLIDVAFTTVWSNTNVSHYCSFPGAAALERELDKINTDKRSVNPVSRVFGGDHVLVPYVVEDGGRAGEQGQAVLKLLAERAVAEGHIKTPETWSALKPAALVSHTVRRWQQRISAWQHTKLSKLLLRQVAPSWNTPLQTDTAHV